MASIDDSIEFLEKVRTIIIRESDKENQSAFRADVNRFLDEYQTKLEDTPEAEYAAELRHRYNPVSGNTLITDLRLPNGDSLSVRAVNSLMNRRRTIPTLSDIISKTQRELKKTRNFGGSSLKEVSEAIQYAQQKLGVCVKISDLFLDAIIVLYKQEKGLGETHTQQQKEQHRQEVIATLDEFEEKTAGYTEIKRYPEQAYIRALRGKYNKLCLDTYVYNLMLANGNKLSVRAENCLLNRNVWTLGELINCSEEKLTRKPARGKGIGDKTLAEIKEAVQYAGYTLGMNIPYVRPEKSQ